MLSQSVFHKLYVKTQVGVEEYPNIDVSAFDAITAPDNATVLHFHHLLHCA